MIKVTADGYVRIGRVSFTPWDVMISTPSFYLYSCPWYEYDEYEDRYESWFQIICFGYKISCYDGMWCFEKDDGIMIRL